MDMRYVYIYIWHIYIYYMCMFNNSLKASASYLSYLTFSPASVDAEVAIMDAFFSALASCAISAGLELPKDYVFAGGNPHEQLQKERDMWPPF